MPYKTKVKIDHKEVLHYVWVPMYKLINDEVHMFNKRFAKATQIF